ncbi:MAG: type II secretion system protein [Armatimonadota bacterium]
MKYLAHNSHQRRGFTLIELLVVIAIIVILMAILMPVFSTVREKARQSNCHANLHQIAVALKLYRQDHGRYPFQPYYDGDRYQGGVSALYPDYVSERNLLICPDDQQVKRYAADAKEKIYSSYNGWVVAPGTSWDFEDVDTTRPDTGASVTGPKRTYNWYGYSPDGWDPFYWNDPTDNNMPYASTLPAWLRNDGLSYRHFPRLANRQAPDNTIVTHCVHHRAQYKQDSAKIDIICTLGGSTKVVNVSVMSAPGADAAHPSKWVKQSE